MKCPSILDLTSAEPCSDPHLRAHIKSCPRCRALRRAWHSLPNDAAEFPPEELPEMLASNWTPRAEPRAVALPGAIYTVSAPGEDIFLLGLVVDLGKEQATIFPLSLETHCAGDWDVLLAPAVLGYSAIIEAWNQIDVLAEQLREQLVLVPDAESIIELYDRALVGEPAPPELPQGPPVSSEGDPRRVFRDRERQRVRPYAELARRMNAAPTMGALLRQARVEQGRKETELAVAIGLDASELRRLEEDQEDLRARIPIKRFADLLDELRVLALAGAISLCRGGGLCERPRARGGGWKDAGLCPPSNWRARWSPACSRSRAPSASARVGHPVGRRARPPPWLRSAAGSAVSEPLCAPTSKPKASAQSAAPKPAASRF